MIRIVNGLFIQKTLLNWGVCRCEDHTGAAESPATLQTGFQHSPDKHHLIPHKTSSLRLVIVARPLPNSPHFLTTLEVNLPGSQTRLCLNLGAQTC